MRCHVDEQSASSAPAVAASVRLPPRPRRDAVRREYHRLMVEHGHLVPRPACTCGDPEDPSMHMQDCPRFEDNDRRLACGWLEGGKVT